MFPSHYHLGTREGCGEGGWDPWNRCPENCFRKIVFKNNFHESTLLSGPIIKIVETLFLSKQFSGIRSAGRIRKIVCYQKQFFIIKIFRVESDSAVELKKIKNRWHGRNEAFKKRRSMKSTI